MGKIKTHSFKPSNYFRGDNTPLCNECLKPEIQHRGNDMTKNSSKPSDGHSKSPKQGPLSKIELREKILPYLYGLGGQGRMQRAEANATEILKLFTTYTNSVLDEAIGKKKTYITELAWKHAASEDAVPVAALKALRKRVG